MRYLKTLVSGILGGMCIGFGGIVFLSLENKTLGALFFTVGLFTICTFGLNLYTGKVCYVFQKDRAYAWNIPVIWIGNLLGTAMVALLAQLSRIEPLSEKAAALCEAKLSDSMLSIFILSAFCNIFIYIAVEGFNKNHHGVGKYLALSAGECILLWRDLPVS